jgi:hypothetical protein
LGVEPLTREFSGHGVSAASQVPRSTVWAFFTVSKVSLRLLTGLRSRLRSMHDMSDRRPRRFRTLARPTALVLIGGLAILFTACGGSGSASPTTTVPKSTSGTSGTPAGSGSSSFTAYRNCLSQHGVTLPNFSRGNGGGRPGSGGFPGEGAPTGSGTPPRGRGGFGGLANNPKYQAAAKACASLRPKGGFGGGFGGRGNFNSPAGAAYRNCLKLHGVTLPTGTSSGTPQSTISSSTFRAAATACAALRPTPSAAG